MNGASVSGSQWPRGRPIGRPEWLVARTFAVLILVGTGILMLPVSNADGRWRDPLSALFTATSAATVTGLTVADTGSAFSRFGQGVILLLIQIGGVGLMTLATFLLVVIGRRMSLSDENLLMRTLGLARAAGLRAVLLKTIVFTVLFELVGTTLLSWRMATVHGMSHGRAWFEGLFHAVSAFCNAGFALRADSLVSYRQDPWVVLTMAGLIVLGGLGFLVWHELTSLRFWRRPEGGRRLSLHTRLVLVSTTVLIGGAAVAFLALEWGHSLRAYSLVQRGWIALFHAVTPRTAGFQLVEVASLRMPTLFLTMGLMFIGGAPCSMAGGVKVTTLVVMILTVRTMVRGDPDVRYAERTLPERAVREGLAIFTLGLLLVILFFGVLLLTEPAILQGGIGSGADALLFETVSAFGTVGLSVGVTGQISPMGRIALILLMVAGRLGPLTLASFIGGREVKQRVRYPEEHIVLG
jgi:trk system potassium uptake protein TrkH